MNSGRNAASELRIAAEKLLTNEPTGIPEATELWKKMKRVTLPIVKKFWILVNPDKMLDLTNV